MSEKLKPCPFCGNEAVLMTHYDTVHKENSHFVACSYCGIRTLHYVAQHYAINTWNERIERRF